MTRVLIIDDDRDVRVTLRDILEEAGYEVCEAADGYQGERLFRSGSLDLVITDILMPEREGLETITSLRKIRPEVKIIAISGGGYCGRFNFLEASKDFGANCVLQKPIAADDLLRTIETLLTQPASEARDAATL